MAIPCSGWLINTYFFAVLGAGSSQSRPRQTQHLMIVSFLALWLSCHDLILLAGGKGVLCGLFKKGANAIHEGYPHDIIYSRRLYLQIPLELDSNIQILRGAEETNL